MKNLASVETSSVSVSVNVDTPIRTLMVPQMMWEGGKLTSQGRYQAFIQ